MACFIFKPTGEMLWQARIIPGEPSSSPNGGKSLRILVDDGHGASHLLDGSKGPATVLDAFIPDLGNIPVRSYWPDGAERDVTFIYSTCGCPVHVSAKRVGERT